MVKNANPADVVRLWLYGKSYDFHPIRSDDAEIALIEEDYRGTAANPARKQKSQIVLHCTAGNNPAENTINNAWDTDGRQASAHYIIERSYVAQAARPIPLGGAADANDFGDFTDALRCCHEDMISYHGGPSKETSIGIEHANVGWGWFAVASRPAAEPSFAGHHSPLSSCPSPINVGTAANPRWRCNHGRPQDQNRFIRLPFNHGGHTDYQAYEDEQYATMILLLRHLCIAHRIPRQFLGRSREEVFRFWHYGGAGASRRLNRSTLHRFRGIFYHRNTHANKSCPGIINRNRLFRGIIDEWWLPVDLEGPDPRAYYSGPFLAPTWDPAVPGVTHPSHFRFQNTGTIVGVVYRDAEIDALNETKSYFELDKLDQYYASVETRRGGLYPIGTNKIWHGGVHFSVRDVSPCVHSVAGGTIVAARVSSNPETDRATSFGQQCFVLVRHRVHLATQADPDGIGQRIDYEAVPPTVFSLYMHLMPPTDIASEHNENPPWFNIWRRANAAVDVGMDGQKGRVFNPDIEVSVGDILGLAGNFRGRRTLHFEVMTHRDRPLTMSPWDQAANVIEDLSQDAICDNAAIDGFVTDRFSDGIDKIDVLEAAPRMRELRTLHKTEWSLTSEAELTTAIPSQRRRAQLWEHIERFTWVREAIAANPDLQTELCDGNGMLWHYHPIRFMAYVNKLILGENRERREEEDHAINVEVDEDNFITDYVDWSAASGQFEPAETDAEAIITHETDPGGGINFQRRAISCSVVGNHNPGPTPAQGTKFSLALLEILQRIRVHYNSGITIDRAFVCGGHVAPNTCCLGTAGGAVQHGDGIAADIRPSNANPARCLNLYRSLVTIDSIFDSHCGYGCAQPSQADLPEGYGALEYTIVPASAAAKLQATPPTALTAAEAAAFRIHLALAPANHPATAESTAPLPVRLRATVTSILVINDQDPSSAGEWTLNASVNGSEIGSFSARSTTSGETITPEGWTHTIILDQGRGETLNISITGEEDDSIYDDTLGTASASFGQSSEPHPWGIGTQTLRSSNGSFSATVVVESLNIEY